MGKILVGTASWSDPGFVAEWYPKGLPANERLPWYAEHFSLVEVNSTFYSIPSTDVTAKWVSQVPDDFTFDIKAFKGLSRHAVKQGELPVDLRQLTPGDKVELTEELEIVLAKRMLDAISPIVEAKKMGAILLQLSPAFSPRKHKITELNRLVDLFCEIGLAVELRHRDWMTTEKALEVADYFESKDVTLVMVDAPDSRNITVMPEFEMVTNPRLAYVRLHGRDAHAYTTGKTVAERFRYEYNDEEVMDITDKAVRLSKEADYTHIVANNNFGNMAPNTAKAIMDRMNEI